MDRSPDGPVASIVVPCRNHASELRDCLRALDEQRTGFAYETIVVDSAADPRVADVTASFAQARLIRSDEGLLPGAARNLGATAARGVFVAFIDADCRAEPDWLAHAVERLQAGARLVGGPVLDAFPWHPVAIADNLLQFADFATGRPDGPARYFPGCNMAARRSSFVELGGFPESLAVGEDTSLCNTALERWPQGLAFVRGMCVRHTGRTGFGAFLRHQARFGYYRGALGHHLTPVQRRWGARWVSVPAAVLKRLSYIVKRTAQWQPVGLLRLTLLLPLILIGLTAWATGFRRGCRA